MLRIANIKVGINEAVTENEEKEALRRKILAMLRISHNDLIDFTIFKKSIDARKKGNIYFVYTVDVSVRNEKKVLDKHKGTEVILTPDHSYKGVSFGTQRMTERPVIVGMGPAGLFAGLLLARNGYKPVVLERGDDVDKRTEKVEGFWKGLSLDTESNVQFGEGGAGTFSDGKLNTLINDKRCRFVIEEFVRAGAPEKILYENKPHIGTDMLKTVVKNMRHEITE